MTSHGDQRFGTGAKNRLADTAKPGVDGARAALETFYHALNQRDRAVLRDIWADSNLTLLNNPVGGMVRGRDAIVELYDRIFNGRVRVQVTFHDVVEYVGGAHAVFAGRESGIYVDVDGNAADLEIRTTRYFRFEEGAWRQFHHHGSIDDAAALDKYQQAVLGAGAGTAQTADASLR